MNDESQLTDDQLRLATTRSLPASTRLDSDTAVARETFLSVGASAESVGSSLDESALLARLTKSCLEAPVIARKPAAPRREWLSLVLTGALAAAALIAIVRIAVDSSSHESQVANAVNPAESGIPQIESRPTQWTLAWNDPLDDEIALASATIQQFTGRERGFDGSLLDMNDRLEALSQELSNETL